MAIFLDKNSTIDYVFSLLTCNSYLVGGYLRDFLLKRESHDLDFVTDIKPERLKEILPYELAFIKTGNFSFKKDDYHITITSMRSEKDYVDFRHPNIITFIDDPKIDYLRRDFTINALYMNNEYQFLDFYENCLNDIDNKILRMIGNPLTRLKEDPLRIIRAYRFKYELDLSFDPSLLDAINIQMPFISKLKKEKVIEEINKSHHQDILSKIFKEYL